MEELWQMLLKSVGSCLEQNSSVCGKNEKGVHFLKLI